MTDEQYAQIIEALTTCRVCLCLLVGMMLARSMWHK